MKVLWVSQFGEPAQLRALGLPPESETIPPLFASFGADVVVVDVTRDPLPEPDAFDGVVVGGSIGSANDVEPWRAMLLAWLTPLRRPLLGICGGHQIYARAHGGRVAPMVERQSGIFPLELPGIAGFTGEVIQMHGEHVAEVPREAEIWARDAAGVQALRYPGRHAWTVQFHPELTLPLAELARATTAGWQGEDAIRAVAGGHAILRAWLASIRLS